jgi:hypothetical protein
MTSRRRCSTLSSAPTFGGLPFAAAPPLPPPLAAEPPPAVAARFVLRLALGFLARPALLLQPLGLLLRLALRRFARPALFLELALQLLLLAAQLFLGFLARALCLLLGLLAHALGFLARALGLFLGFLAHALGFLAHLARFRLRLGLRFRGRLDRGLARRPDLRFGFLGEPLLRVRARLGFGFGAQLGLGLGAHLGLGLGLDPLALRGRLALGLLARLGEGVLLLLRGLRGLGLFGGRRRRRGRRDGRGVLRGRRRGARRGLRRRRGLARRRHDGGEVEIRGHVHRPGCLGGCFARAAGLAGRRGAAGRHFADEAALVEGLDQLLERGIEALADLLRHVGERGAAIDRREHRAVGTREVTRLARSLLDSLPGLRVDGGRVHSFRLFYSVIAP